MEHVRGRIESNVGEYCMAQSEGRMEEGSGEAAVVGVEEDCVV